MRTQDGPERIFIIDAMALLFRSFYALGRSSLSTRQGVPTGAVYGAAMFLNKLLVSERPDYLVAVSDTAAPTFRHKLYPQYKAHRDEMPNDLAAQIPLFFELLANYHCPLLRADGFEADDLIGTIVRRYASAQVHAFIVSGDKDFMQLIGPHVRMYAPKKDEEAQIIDIAAVREKFHCAPEQVIDALALIGDTADNVPGVKGIGEKGAAKLIETYGSLDGIYANLDKITAVRQRQGLEAGRAAAYLSRELVTLKTDLPVDLSLPQLACQPDAAMASPELLAFFQQLEFKSLVAKVQTALAKLPAGGTVATVTSTAVPESMAESTLREPEPSTASPLVCVVNDAATQEQLSAAITACTNFVLVVQASGEDVATDKATSLVFLTDQGAAFTLDLNEEGIYNARALLRGPQLVIGHGLKLAVQMLANVGIDIIAKMVDLELCDYLLDPNHYDHTLTSMALRHLSQELAPAASGSERAQTMLALYTTTAPQIVARDLGRILWEVEMPLVPVLAAMERKGFYIDAAYLAAYSDELAAEATRLETEIYAAAGGPFNINSPKQLQELLYDRLNLQELAGLKRIKRTKTGLSTDESVLSLFAKVHPVPALILSYRTIMKLKNTYVDTLPQFISPSTNRVHTRFNQAVAATGRLSSDRPNLQNIPVQSALGRRIRQAFKPEHAGWILISADYSQVEIRLLAHLADAVDLIEAFKNGLDVHTVTAAKIFGVPVASVTPQLRSRAKAVNFGIIYGMGPQRLAAETGTTLTEAKDFIKRYFEVYPGIKAYIDGLIDKAKAAGYCRTMLGRQRAIPELADRNLANRARGENIAVNAPIQGSAADLIKLAMIRLAHELGERQLRTQLLLQVHDELVFSAPEAELAEVIPVIRQAMEHALTTKVPLKVDIKTGADWLAAH